MALTAKQELFAINQANGYPDLECYRLAYDAENQSDSACSTEAWKLKRNPEIAQRIQHLRDMVAIKELFPLIDRMTIIKDICNREDAKDSDKLNGVKLYADLVGDNAPQKMAIEHSGSIESNKPIEQLTDEQLEHIASRSSAGTA